MGIVTSTSNDSRLQFPKLMRSGVHTVLFATETEGMVLEVLGKDAPYTIGSIQKDLVVTDYHDYNGTVRVSNGVRKQGS